MRAEPPPDLLLHLRLRPGWPLPGREGVYLLIQGEGGIITTTGYPDKLAKVGVPISDVASSLYAALGIVLALYQREHTGRGPEAKPLSKCNNAIMQA